MPLDIHYSWMHPAPQISVLDTPSLNCHSSLRSLFSVDFKQGIEMRSPERDARAVVIAVMRAATLSCARRAMQLLSGTVGCALLPAVPAAACDDARAAALKVADPAQANRASSA